MTLLDCLEQDGIQLRRVASTHGGEYAGSCPLCGGRDRFRVWPEQNDGHGSWYCRGCDKGGDDIEYLKYFRQMNYLEACSYLGREPEPLSQGRPKQPEWTPRETVPPGEVWLSKAGLLVEWAQQQLWSDKGRAVLEYLQGGRGLTEESIRAFHLGWNPETLNRKREDWGLLEEVDKAGRPKQVWIPAGVVIPAYVDNILHRVRIRRLEPGADPLYIVISGGSSAPMILGENRRVFIIVESELCGILLHQEIGDLAGVVAMGSAYVKPDDVTTHLLRQAELILIGLDNDSKDTGGNNSGAKQAWNFWLKHFEQARRLPPVRGKDPGEMWKAGVDLGAWVRIGIEDYLSKQLSPKLAEPIEPMGANVRDCDGCGCLIRWRNYPFDGKEHRFCGFEIYEKGTSKKVELDKVRECLKVNK